MDENAFLISVPKQERSRQSFERVIDSALTLLEQRGSADFTLMEISELSDVSIGSIYCRMTGKDDLLRIVQIRVNAKLESEHDAVLKRAADASPDLPSLCAALVDGLAAFLRRNAPILRAMTACASNDAVIAQAGKQSYSSFARGFEALVLRHRAEIRHPHPEQAAAACLAVAYAALARYLGIGTEPTSTGGGPWKELVEHLTVMCTCFLMFGADISPVANGGRHSRSSRPSAVPPRARRRAP